MKVYISNTSPYARKVRIILRERGLIERTEEVQITPFSKDTNMPAVNPLGKIPALELADGRVLFDSPVISAYLDSLGDHPALIPQGDDRWPVLVMEALADGILDLGVGLLLEHRRPENERSPATIDRWRGQLANSIAAIPRCFAPLPNACNLGHIALASALSWLDFRHPDIDWRNGNSEIEQWFLQISKRPSLVETEPHL